MPNEIAPDLLVGIPSTGESIDKLAVEPGHGQRRAGETTDSARELIGQGLESALDNAKHTIELVNTASLGSLESKAGEVVTLEERCTVEDTASEVRRLDAGERVDCASVTTNAESVWVGRCTGEEINEDVCKVIRVGGVTAIPVQRDALLASVVHEITWVVSRGAGASNADGEELLQSLAREVATWLLSGVVGHEVCNQVVRGWSNQAGEGTPESVWIVLDGERSDAICVGSELVEGKAIDTLAGDFPEVVPLAPLHDADVAAVEVRITTYYAGVVLVLAVRANDALGIAEEEWQAGREAASNGPLSRQNVTRDEDSDNCKACGEIWAHTICLSETIDSL